MGKRNRERIARILAGIEKPYKLMKDVAAAAAGDSIAQTRLEDAVMKSTGLEREVTPANVARACRLIGTVIRIQGLAAARAGVIDKMPSEVAQVIASGQDPFLFYWNIPDFKVAWAKLKLTEEDLRGMIEQVKGDKNV